MQIQNYISSICRHFLFQRMRIDNVKEIKTFISRLKAEGRYSQYPVDEYPPTLANYSFFHKSDLKWFDFFYSVYGKEDPNFISVPAYLYIENCLNDRMLINGIKEKNGDYQKESLLYAEMVKSRTFLEMLAMKQVKGAGKYDQDILAKDREFQRKISFHRKILAECENSSSGKMQEKCSRAKASLEDALKAYERFIDEVKLKDSELSSLITVEIAPVDKIQSLLEPSITLLEYFMTSDSTYVWLVTRDKIKIHEFPFGKKKMQLNGRMQTT